MDNGAENSGRPRGRKGGRPAKLSAKEIKTVRALLKTADIPVSEIAARFGIARSTLYRTVLKPTDTRNVQTASRKP